MSERVEPVDIDAEESVLGAMILLSGARDIAGEMLIPNDFYREQHRIIFGGLVEMGRTGKSVDVILLAAELKDKGLLEDAGDKMYLSALTDTCPNPHNAEAYAARVKEKANLRRLINTGHDLINKVYGEATSLEALAEAQRIINDPNLGKTIGGEPQDEATAFFDYFERMKASQTGEKFSGLDTGFDHLNELINGLNQGLYIFGGSPSSGKTTFFLQMAHQVAEKNKVPVMYWSLDQGLDDLRTRTLSRLADVNNRKIAKGVFTQISPEIELMERAAKEYKELSLMVHLYDAYGFSLDKVAFTARREMRDHGTEKCLVVIDHLHKIIPDAKEKYVNDFERITLVTTRLSRLAMELASPIIVVSELNRDAYEGKKGRTAGMKGFKSSGEIEYSADVAGQLTLDGEWDRDGHRDVALRILKQRMGELGKIKLDFDLRYSRFLETGREELDVEDEY